MCEELHSSTVAQLPWVLHNVMITVHAHMQHLQAIKHAGSATEDHHHGQGSSRVSEGGMAGQNQASRDGCTAALTPLAAVCAAKWRQAVAQRKSEAGQGGEEQEAQQQHQHSGEACGNAPVL